MNLKLGMGKRFNLEYVHSESAIIYIIWMYLTLIQVLSVGGFRLARRVGI